MDSRYFLFNNDGTSTGVLRDDYDRGGETNQRIQDVKEITDYLQTVPGHVDSVNQSINYYEEIQKYCDTNIYAPGCYTLEKVSEAPIQFSMTSIQSFCMVNLGLIINGTGFLFCPTSNLRDKIDQFGRWVVDNRFGFGVIHNLTGKAILISKGSYHNYQMLALENGQISVENNFVNIHFMEGGVEQEVGANSVYAAKAIKYHIDHEHHFHIRF